MLFNWLVECLTLLLLPYSSISTSGLTVFLGRQTQQGPNPNEVSRGVSNIIKHPNYNKVTKDNDITLLQLNLPVNFTDYIRPVCLASSSSTFFSRTVSWVTGWGNTNSGGKYLVLLIFISVSKCCTLTVADVFYNWIWSSVSLPSSKPLQEVDVPIVGNRQCKCLYGVSKITDNMICAGLLEGGKDSCQVTTPILLFVTS